MSSKQEAEEIAESVLNGLAMEFCAADITVEGVPDVTPGDVVEVKQFGKMYSGKYLVDGVRHLVNAGARDPYVTRLKLIRNSAPEP